MQKSQSLPHELLNGLRRQKYQIVGGHSAVKKCRWLHQSLVEGRSCYKHKFFGIRSWQCVQMTPAIAHCTMRCRFCWRVQPDDAGTYFDETVMPDWDDPTSIVEGCIQAQRRILSGYKANPRADRERYDEALKPKHVAISLTGEPTLYPDLGNLIREFHRRRFTTFVVTNGTLPQMLSDLDEEPTQLYVSVCAPDEKTFLETCRPQVPDAWQRLNHTLELLPSFDCPTVVRHTLVRNLNMKNPERYAKIIARGNPTYIEPKGYVCVGYSRNRLTFDSMPTHTEIRQFAKDLAAFTGYKILNEATDSRVVLLSRLEKPIMFY